MKTYSNSKALKLTAKSALGWLTQVWKNTASNVNSCRPEYSRFLFPWLPEYQLVRYLVSQFVTDTNSAVQKNGSDFKLSPFSKCSMLSSGLFPGVWILYADPFRNTVSVPSSQAVGCVKNAQPPAYEGGKDSVPKRRHIKFRRRGITQKKAYKRIRTWDDIILSNCLFMRLNVHPREKEKWKCPVLFCSIW